MTNFDTHMYSSTLTLSLGIKISSCLNWAEMAHHSHSMKLKKAHQTNSTKQVTEKSCLKITALKKTATGNFNYLKYSLCCDLKQFEWRETGNHSSFTNSV